jgi:hypothetical protein
MVAVVFLGIFIALAVVSLLGLTADSRDLRPRRPLQAPGDQPDAPFAELTAHTALPPYRQLRLRRP